MLIINEDIIWGEIIESTVQELTVKYKTKLSRYLNSGSQKLSVGYIILNW